MMEMMKKKTWEDTIVDVFCYLFLALTAVITLFPFLNVVSKSVSADWAVISGKVGVLPVGFQLGTLKYVAGSQVFLNGFKISTLTAIAGTAASLAVTVLTAYPLSKKHLPGIRTVLVLYVFTMIFSGGMIPTYILVKKLGLVNNLLALILPGMLSVYNMLIIKNYFESIPESLEESARLDGATNLVILFKIVLPLSVPVLATIGLFYTVGYWNDYLHALLYINKPALKTLQIYLRDMVLETTQLNDAAYSKTMDDLMNITPEGVRAASVVAVTLPILFVYPFLQKYFIKGILIGSVKG